MECRLCLDSGSTELVQRVCHCKGSMASVHFACLLKDAQYNGLNSVRWTKCPSCHSKYTDPWAGKLYGERLRISLSAKERCIHRFTYFRSYLEAATHTHDRDLVSDLLRAFCKKTCTIYFAAHVEYHCFLARIGENVTENLQRAAKHLDSVINHTENAYMGAHMGECLAHAYYKASTALNNDKPFMEKAITVQMWACAERQADTELYYHSMCNLIGYQCLCYESPSMKTKAETLKTEIVSKFGPMHKLSKQVNDMCVFIRTKTAVTA